LVPFDPSALGKKFPQAPECVAVKIASQDAIFGASHGSAVRAYPPHIVAFVGVDELRLPAGIIIGQDEPTESAGAEAWAANISYRNIVGE
jgi:hypothetical protein